MASSIYLALIYNLYHFFLVLYLQTCKAPLPVLIFPNHFLEVEVSKYASGKVDRRTGVQHTS